MTVPEDLIHRLIEIAYYLDECLLHGESLLTGESAASFRQRVAAAISGETADDNADALGIALENASKARKEILEILKEHGVTKFRSQGEPFDQDRHECLKFRSCEPDQEGQVLEERKAGYMRHDELLRPAQVIVGRIS